MLIHANVCYCFHSLFMYRFDRVYRCFWLDCFVVVSEFIDYLRFIIFFLNLCKHTWIFWLIAYVKKLNIRSNINTLLLFAILVLTELQLTWTKVRGHWQDCFNIDKAIDISPTVPMDPWKKSQWISLCPKFYSSWISIKILWEPERAYTTNLNVIGFLNWHLSSNVIISNH